MPPVVYVGPSLEADAVRNRLPQAQVMPPIRRGDLYRDRLLGFRVFLILDGVFFENLAISPREVVDVIRDGGIVAGASSMGAMRAAECWPVGMRGIGTIYRLFRRGRLTSDDEVAIAFLSMPPYPAATVPLINVRFAVSRAVRDRTLDGTDAGRIVRSAAELHFSERTWDAVLQSAGILDPGNHLATALQVYDLKRTDAIRALDRVHKWIADSPDISSDEGREAGRRLLGASRREMPHGLDEGTPVPREALWRWLVASGRYRRYAAPALNLFIAGPAGRSARKASLRGDDTVEVAARLSRGQWLSRLGIGQEDLASALRHRQASADLVGELTRCDTELARTVWAEIAVSGDADAIVLRFLALRKAIEWARVRCMQPGGAHRAIAKNAIAYAHGFRTWWELEASLGHHLELWSWIEQLAEETALAKCVRQALFNAPHGAEAIELLERTFGEGQ